MVVLAQTRVSAGLAHVCGRLCPLRTYRICVGFRRGRFSFSLAAAFIAPWLPSGSTFKFYVGSEPGHSRFLSVSLFSCFVFGVFFVLVCLFFYKFVHFLFFCFFVLFFVADSATLITPAVFGVLLLEVSL